MAKNILIFSDGEEVMNFFIGNVAYNENLPDVIFLDILDINMPIIDG